MNLTLLLREKLHALPRDVFEDDADVGRVI
jgi:hypothetical protein